MQSQVIVNAHVHLHPERLAEAIWRWFDTHAWHICSTGPREWPEDTDLERISLRGPRIKDLAVC